MFKQLSPILVCAVLLLAANACSHKMTQQEMTFWQGEANTLRLEVTQQRSELEGIHDPAQREQLEKSIAFSESIADAIDEKIAKAQTAADLPWQLGEAALTVAAGFFPPLMVAVPWIRSLRRSLTHVFKSVDAGGGVVNGEAAKTKLIESPGAFNAFKKFKKANGTPTPA